METCFFFAYLHEQNTRLTLQMVLKSTTNYTIKLIKKPYFTNKRYVFYNKR